MSEQRLTIGLFISRLDNDYAYDICKGVEYAAKELDVNLVLFPGMYINPAYTDFAADPFEYQYNSVFHFAMPESLDGLIVAIGTIGTYLDSKDSLEFLRHFKGIPILTLEEAFPDFPSITVDSTMGLKNLLLHLIHDHHRQHIGYISGRPGNSDAEARLKIYKSTIVEAGLPLDESLIAHGDFSEYCEPLVEELLDAHPEIDALCFANDQMALGGYRALKRRGIEIGKDILVTGFDDVPLALALEPALSTVRANVCELGSQAVKEILHLIQTGTTNVTKLDSSMVLRESCCYGRRDSSHAANDTDTLLAMSQEALTEYIADLVFKNDKDTFLYHQIYLIMKKYISVLLAFVFHKSSRDDTITELLSVLQNYMKSDSDLYFFNIQISYYMNMIETIILSLLKDDKERYHFMELSGAVSKQLLSSSYSRWYNDRNEYKENSLISSNIVRDAILNSANSELAYAKIIEKLKRLHLTSAYIFTPNETEIRRLPDNSWQIPESFCLRGYFNDITEESLQDQNCNIATKDLFRNPYLPQNRRTTMIITPIYTTDEQHGVFLCEMNPADYHQLYWIDLELGTTLKFLKMEKTQREMNQQLEYTLFVLNEKNQQLSEISTIDELTGLKNRRGFLSETQRMITSTAQEGKQALLLFVDMDNLKSVNDMFGHENGDFALRTIAAALSSSMEQEAIVGRIGGDEFVAFTMLDHSQSGESITKKIHATLAGVNATSEKPYYIEASIGFVNFICEPGNNIQILLKQADDALYESKSHKRKSVLKEPKAN